MKKTTLFLFALAFAVLGQRSSFAETSMVVCTGHYVISTNVDVVITLRDFGNGAGSCDIRDVFGNTILSVTGRTSDRSDNLGFKDHVGAIYYRTADNYSASCTYGEIAQGPWAGQLVAGWNYAYSGRLGSIRNGNFVGRCQRY